KSGESSLSCEYRHIQFGNRIRDGHLLGSHVHTVHIEHVIHRGPHELISVCEKQRVDTVHRLRHIRHGNLVGVAVENVECQPGVYRVAHRDRLAQNVRRRQLLAWFVPDAPLINHKLGAPLTVELAHFLPVVGDDFIDAKAAQQDLVPLRHIEIRRFQRRRPQIGIEVDRESVRRIEPAHAFEEAGGPTDVFICRMATRAGGDEKWLFVVRKLRYELAVLLRILLRSHRSAAAPGLVADSPVLNIEWLGIAIFGPLICQGQRPRRCIAIRNPVMKLGRRTRSHIGGDVRLRPDQAAKVHEFVNAELIRLCRVGPGRHAPLPEVVGAWTRLTDPIAPVIAIGEASARPTEIRRGNHLHVIDKLFTDSIDVGNRRVSSDPHAVVNNASKVLDEMPVDIRVDHVAGFVRREHNFRVRTKCQMGGGESRKSERTSCLEKPASVHECLLREESATEWNCSRWRLGRSTSERRASTLLIAASTVNDHRQRDAPVKKHRHKYSSSRSANPPRRFSRELAVLYEDDAVVAVNKPAGLLAVPAPGSDSPSALSLFSEHLSNRRQRIFTVHRIDRFASGVLLFAKTHPDRDALVTQFLAHTPVRRYLVVVRGHLPDKQGTLVHYFRKEGMHQKLASAKDPKSARAELRYSLVQPLRGASLLRVI